MKRVSLAIDSDLGNVAFVSVAVRAICLNAGLAASDADHVELCVVEAITNSIRHAYHGEKDHRVAISVVAGESQMQFEVCDSGSPMGEDQVSRLVQRDSLDEADVIDRALLPEGGRGLQIIRSVMDEVIYEREGNQNCLRMIKRLMPAYGDAIPR